MTRHQRSARAVTRLIVALVVLAVLGGGLFLLHRHRKEVAARQALADGNAAFDAGRHTEAATQLGRYLVAAPRDVDALLKYAKSQLYRRPQSKGSGDQAIAALETIRRIDPAHREASELLAQLYLGSGDLQAAERVSRGWVAAAPGEPAAVTALASTLSGLRRPDEAAPLLRDLLKKNPADAKAAGALAFLTVQQAAATAPATAPATGPATRPDDRAALLARVTGALQVLDAAVAAAPNDPKVLLARARFRLLVGQYRSAREDVEAAAKTEPPDVTTCLELAHLQADLRLAEAAASFRKAEGLAPADPLVYGLEGQVLLESPDLAAGAALADRAVAAPVGDRSLDLLPLCVELYVRAGRPADAEKRIAAFQAVASADILELCRAIVDLARPEAAARAVTDLEKLAGRAGRAGSSYGGYPLPRAWLLLARAQRSRGAPARAVDCYRRYLDLAGRSVATALAQVELARTYALLGREVEAAETAAVVYGIAPWKPRAVLAGIEFQAVAARPKGARPNRALVSQLRDRARQFAEAVPDDVNVQVLHARVTAWAGQPDEADRLLQALAGRLPDARLPALLARCDLAVEAARLDDAVARCREAVDVADASGRPDLQARLLELQLLRGDRSAADALAADLEKSAEPAMAMRLAPTLLRAGQVERARALLARAAAHEPTDLRTRVQLLELTTQPADVPSRQELLEQVRAIEGERGREWRYWQARVWMESDGWKDHQKEIETLLKAVLEEDPGAQAPMLALATLYERVGSSDAALDLWRKAFEADPANLPVAGRFIDAAARVGRWSDVDRVLSVVPADRPEFEGHRIARALRLGEAGRARQMLEARVEAAPQDVRSRLQLARMQLAAGDWAGAQRLFAEAARIAPDDPDVLIARVQAHLDRQDWDQAIALCDERLARGPSPEALSLRATAHAGAGRPADAEKDLRAVVATKGWEERGLVAVGQLHARGGDTDKALSAWKAALETVPGSLAVQREIAATLLAGTPQQREEGLALVQDLVKAHPGDAQLLGLRAEALVRTNPAEAEKDYRELVQRAPGSAGAFLRLAQLARGRGQREAALEWLDKGLAGSPSSVPLLLARSDLLRDTEPARATASARQAVAAIEAMLHVQPRNQELAISLAAARARAGEGREAARGLREFVDTPVGGRSVEARLALAGVLMQMREFPGADEQIRSAAELAPEASEPVQLRIEWFARQARWGDVVTAAETWRKGHPEDFAVCGVAGEWLLKSPDPSRAIPFLEAMVAKFPDEPTPKKAIALAHYQAGRIPQAVELLQKAVAAHPANVGLANNLAWMLCEDLKKAGEAARVAENALKGGAADPEYPFLLDTWGVVQYRLGVAAKSAGRAAEANRYFQESRTRLEECRRDPRADSVTRAGAALHLARTLAESDSAAASRVIRELLDDKPALSLLSEKEQAEAKALADRLSAPTARAR